MKYRHAYHAGNFADVHKHVTLLALLTALKRKDKGFLYFETHAGRGVYDISSPSPDSEAGTGLARLLGSIGNASPGNAQAGLPEEIGAYLERLRDIRTRLGNQGLYPGSPLLAASALRAQDRGVLVELINTESRALEQALQHEPGLQSRVRVEHGDGFEKLRGSLPPPERRGLTLIDPPYEETRQDFERVVASVTDALRRFQTGVLAVWYPIKDEREVAVWQTRLMRELPVQALVGELWLYPRDSRVGLNGSGLLIVNPPYLLEERMRLWLPELQRRLATGPAGGTRIQLLGAGHRG